MIITLKYYQYSSKLSEETCAFSAVICADGRKVGEVANHGQGGPDDILWTDKKAGEQITEFCQLQQPGIEPVSHMLGMFHGAYEKREQLQRWCRTKVLFLLPHDDERDGYRCVTFKGKSKRAAAIKHVKAKYPEARIIEVPKLPAIDLNAEFMDFVE